MEANKQMEINKYSSKYGDWKEGYNWETCKTNRKEYGKFLCSFLTNKGESSVVNLNGSWGTGKTELLRRLYVELAEQKHAVVYIDAWESDFSNDALAVVCSEVLTQLDSIFDKRNRKARKAIDTLKKGINTCLEFTQGVATVTGEVLTAKVTKGASEAIKAIPDFNDNSVSSTNCQLIEKVQKSQIERVQAMKDIKKQITFLAELMCELYGLKNQIVILVDELDRCRPSYAVEILEVIKHFFQTKGCVFLVATDTEALQHSVGALYGTEFNSEIYLRRFFDRKIALPEVSIVDYLNCQNIDLPHYEDKGVIFSSFDGDTNKHILFFSEIFTFFKMELRDIDQALQKFFASLNFVITQDTYIASVINGVVLMLGILEELNNVELFKARSSNSIDISAFSYGLNNDLIKFQLLLVSKTHARGVHQLNGRVTTYNKEVHVLGIQAVNLRQHISVFNQNDDEVCNQMVIYEMDQDYKYWLWDDYRKIIELSGHIE
jgi:Ni2+-binding GTPase involved in maturation of urease and hydrogenase